MKMSAQDAKPSIEPYVDYGCAAPIRTYPPSAAPSGTRCNWPVKICKSGVRLFPMQPKTRGPQQLRQLRFTSATSRAASIVC